MKNQNKFIEDETNKIIDEKISMQFNLSITKKMLEDELVYLKTLEKRYKKQLNDAYKLPDDPTVGQDVFGDGIINQNPLLKFDLATGNSYTYGYILGSINAIKKALNYLSISKDDYEKLIKKEKEIEEHNKKEMKRVKDALNKKINEKKKS